MTLTHILKSVGDLYGISTYRFNELIMVINESDLKPECRHRGDVQTERECFVDVDDVVNRLKDEIVTDIQNHPSEITVDELDNWLKKITNSKDALADLEI